MSDKYDGWELTRETPLGSGGQGKVYLARSPERVKQIQQQVQELKEQFRALSSEDYNPVKLAKLTTSLGSPDDAEHLGALKVFDIPAGPEMSEQMGFPIPETAKEGLKALHRLEEEVHALGAVEHPAILKLLHANVPKRFIVTEYHPHGSLDEHLNSYKGQVLKALEAFRPLVDAVRVIHEESAIHRDIKTKNIFVACDGRLVLGDFGIVFFKKDGPGDRLTTTYERVGTRGWMGPWAENNARLALEAISPALDIYPLAKVLWSLISGRDSFLFWEYDRKENNLEKAFPYDPMMPRVNRLLSQCIVREESECRLTASALLAEVDALIDQARRIGQKPDDGGLWPCRMCGRGHYSMKDLTMSAFIGNSANRAAFRLFVCDSCGHAEMFK